MELIGQVLSTDAESRKVGVSNDLFELNDLRVDCSWKYYLPTLVSKNRTSNNNVNYVRNTNTFINNFYKTFRILYKIPLDNLLVAGGAVRTILLDEYNSGDVDIFMYGIKDINQANKRVYKFITDLNENIEKYKKEVHFNELLDQMKVDIKNDKEKIKALKDEYQHLCNSCSTNINVAYNGNTVTIFIDNIKIQIVLRLYNTKSEILHGFDLGSSSVGFDGEKVYLTTLSKFCYENMVNIYDGTRRSTTYELRLIKYFEKGFDIILPNFDISKLRTEYLKYELKEVCNMPYLTFSYYKLDGNLIYVSKFYNKNNDSVTSDYDFYELKDNNDLEYKLNYFNLKQIVSKENKFIFYKEISDELKTFYDVYKDFTKWELQFKNNIIKYNFVEKMYKVFYKQLSEGSIPINIINNYFNVIDAKQFVNDIYLSNKSKQEVKNNISEIILKQKVWIRDQINKAYDGNLKWMIDNPTTQLSSSFNPIIEDDKVWYGNFYTDNPGSNEMIVVGKNLNYNNEDEDNEYSDNDNDENNEDSCEDNKDSDDECDD